MTYDHGNVVSTVEGATANFETERLLAMQCYVGTRQVTRTLSRIDEPY